MNAFLLDRIIIKPWPNVMRFVVVFWASQFHVQQRRRLLWLPEEGESEELDSDEDGISALSDGSFAENAGKLL